MLYQKPQLKSKVGASIGGWDEGAASHSILYKTQETESNNANTNANI